MMNPRFPNLGLWIAASISFVISSYSFGAQPSPATSTYRDVQTFMYDLAKKHPEHVRVFDLGQSDSGDLIQGLQIGEGSVKNLVVGTHHGNEYGSTEVAKAVAASLAEAPIIGQTLYVIPVLNISGYNVKRRSETSTRGPTLDPNRDYPGPCGTNGPFKLKSTTALAQFVASNEIVTSATLHTYVPAVVYPWGVSTHDLETPYTDIFKMLVQSATVESKYRTGNSSEEVYPADGTFEDYAFWKHGIWSILFEMGFSHSPDDSAVDELNRVNVPGIRRMMEQAPRTRAEDHDFKGRCDASLSKLDLHIE